MSSNANWQAVARRKARKYGINPSFFVRQMGAEARGQDLRSPAGAQGPAQIMPGTARSWGVRNVHDIHEAYDAAAKHMAQYLHSYGGDWAKALTAYNAGPGRVGKALPSETQNYIRTVLGGSSPGEQSTGTTTTPAKTTQNIDGAILAALSEHHAGNKLAGAVLNKLAYNPKYAPKTTPAKTTTTTFGATKHVPDHHDGVSRFDGKPVAGWIAAELRWARAHGWKGTVTSGFRSYADQKRIYDSGVRPAAKPGTSNHEGTKFPLGAVDVTDAQQLAQILKQRGSPLKWAGAKDPVHFSHPHGGGY